MFGNFNGLFSQEWLESAKMYCGESLTDEMVQQSIHEASDFFHIDDPMIVAEYKTTGVFLNGSEAFSDDILVFSREQMNDMGITGKETFDLVMTHEAAHRMLQGMETGFNAHQEELCCDFMSGVRAGLNGMDFSGMQESLALEQGSDTHPAGVSRVYSIKEGADFAEIYRATHGSAPTFQECLDYFKENVGREQVTLRQYGTAESTGSVAFADSSYKGYDGDTSESAGGIGFVASSSNDQDNESTEALGSVAFADSSYKGYDGDTSESAGGIGFVASSSNGQEDESTEALGSVAFADSSYKGYDGDTSESAGGIGFVASSSNGQEDESTETLGSVGFAENDSPECNSSFKGYTKDEINRKIAKAEKEQRFYESEVRHHTNMAKHALTRANEEYHWREVRLNQAQVDKWKSESLKWRWTKPDKN